MSDFDRSGVFASAEEIEEIAALAASARATPVIAMSSAHGLERGGFAGDAWRLVQEAVYRYALAHGLPDIVGFYGFDGANGEFLR